MSLMFECKYCPATFRQFKKLVEHYETRHNKNGKKYRSLQDVVSYAGVDSGCQQATNYLGYQSSCLKCPFYKCILDELGIGVARAKKRIRNEEIWQRFKEGQSTSDLAKAFDVSSRTIQRIVRHCG